MTVLQLLGSLRGIDARLKRATSSGLFDSGSPRATAANRRALLLAKEHIVDTVAHEIAAIVKAKQQLQQQQESDGGAAAAAASAAKKTTAISAALGGEITDLALHQFEVFLPIATSSLAALSQ